MSKIMKTSINLPDELGVDIRAWNKEHPDKQIGISGTCRRALENALRIAQKS